ncbi:class III lanthipeptide [Micromonospora sp. WMMD882]|nr:class III lanthipeptide [Micromonospora sp. WMMD882]WBB77792.1 class III lanthipeptide [Micromonospora sp. WMMD882]
MRMAHILDLQAVNSTGAAESPLVSDYSWMACEDSTVSLLLCQHPQQPE